MSKILSIYLGHDSNFTFLDTDVNEPFIIELERFFEERYFRFPQEQKEAEGVLLKILDLLEKGGIDNDFDTLCLSHDGPSDLDFSVINFKKLIKCDHHLAHALGAFSLSPFEESLVLSYDGSGNDGSFNYYKFDRSGFSLIEKLDFNIGWGYQHLSKFVTSVSQKSKNDLALSGKLMGLSNYGKPYTPAVVIMQDFMEKYFIDHDPSNMSKYMSMLGSIKSINEFDFAASIQQAAENIIHNFFFKRGMPENLCLTGGCGLNILINQQIREMNKNVYIPPNPSDCGLSVGQAVYAVWEETKSIIKLPSITYSGLPIQDIESLDQLAIERSAKEVDMLELAKDLKGGKIIGVCRDGSEVGPRSLGNRSILCDPVYPDMKDILNAKIKRREWYRPFAGICRLEDAHKFFDIDKNQSSEYMVFCPKVKEEYREALASITHVDGTCRIQTVTEDQNKFIFDLLSQESFGRVPVLLNTSFNINGKPILSSCKTALSILDSTPIDSVVIQDYHFKKNLD